MGGRAGARFVLLVGGVTAQDTVCIIAKAKRERANHLRRLSRRRRTPEQVKRDADAVRRWHLDHPQRIADAKRQWRKKFGRAYMQRYDALTPGRAEYKSRWAREKRRRQNEHRGAGHAADAHG